MAHDALRRDEAQVRAALISNVRYAVHLDVDADMGQATYGSTTVVNFDAADGASSFINFEAEAAEVWLNGRRLPDSAFDGDRIRLDQLRASDNVLRVVGRARYHSDGVGLHRIQDPADGEVYLYTHFEPFDAHQVFACFDQPDLKAPTTLSVTAPAAWSLIANAPELREEPAGGGRTTRHFASTRSISTYLNAVVAGPYQRVTSSYASPLTGRTIELGLSCRKSMLPYLESDEIFEITRQGLEFYETYFGIEYPFEKYDQVYVAESNMGAMENPGCITFNESYLFRSRVTDQQRGARASVILHEMAHMWFGDLVTMTWWDDLWLNESFATFMALVSQTAATQFASAAGRSFGLRVAGSMESDQKPTTHPIVADASDTDVARANFDGITYGKGAATLRQLHAYVGADAFRDGVRSYMRKHQWGNATLGDFLGELEAASGRDMSDWAQRWLQTSGINTLSPELTSRGGLIESLSIAQTADPERPTLRPHRLGVGLYVLGADGRLQLSERIDVDVDGPLTDVSAQFRGHRADAVLLNEGELAFAKTRLDPASLATFSAHAADLSDPMARQNIAGTMWNMVRDAEMPGRQFFDTGMAWLAGGSPDADSLRRVLNDIGSAIAMSHPSARDELMARAAGAARVGMERAVPGSDEQLVYATSYFARAEAAADMRRFERLLAGGESIDGLTLDVGLRWSLVNAIAKHTSHGARVIAAQERLDDTDIGRRNGAQIRASLPTAAAKERAWKLLTSAPETQSAKALQSTAAGFQVRGQELLTRQYTPGRYERLVPGWWRTLSQERARILTDQLFPASFGDQTPCVRLAERLIARGDLPRAAVRLLTEKRDDLLRSQRAQAFDLLSRGAAPAAPGLSV